MWTLVFSLKSTFSWILFLCFWSSNHAQQSRCFDAQDKPIYDPCYCQDTAVDGNLDITCLEEFVSYQQIQVIFQDSTAPTINRFAIVPVSGPTNQIEIIDNLLADKRARVIAIVSCPAGSTLKINQDAFRSSSNYAQELSITECDVDQLNWSFLSTFVQMSNIRLTKVTGIHSFSSLPRLIFAEQLSFIDSSGFDNSLLNFPASSLPRLKTLVFNGTTDLTSQVADKIMLALASNGVPLNDLTIRGSSSINRVPGSFGDIGTLSSIDLSNNKIDLVSSNSFNFTKNLSVRLIDLSSNLVNNIAFNAFSPGNYGGATILLDKNVLTDFAFEVFLEVLVEMSETNSGLVSIADNPISCTECNLAWLIRDNPDLKQWVQNGICSVSGTPFEELDPSSYGSTCAVITTPRPTITSTTEPSTTEPPTTEPPTTEPSTTEPPTTEIPTTEMSTEIPTTDKITTTIAPTTNVSTSSTSTTTEEISTTIGPNTDNTQLLLYITCGLVALILLILIIGCIYMIFTKNARKNRRESLTSGSSNSFSTRSRSSAIPVNNTSSGLPQSNVAPPPQQRPPSMSRANIPYIPPIVQGPGGKLYVQSSGVANTKSAYSTTTKAQQNQVKTTVRQGGYY